MTIQKEEKMKKILAVLMILTVTGASVLSAQTNASVNIDDSVYEILRSAQNKGICSPLSNVKPYTQQYIINKLYEIAANLDNQEKIKELEIIQQYLARYELEEGVNLKKGYVKFDNHNSDFPATLIISDSIYGNIGSGFYEKSYQNSTGFDVFNNFNFKGDLGENFSYFCKAYMGFTDLPLEKMGTYEIGPWLYHDQTSQPPRTITSWRNNSFLPYSFSKYWDGSSYYIQNLSADGLESWPFGLSFAFGMSGEIHASFFNNMLELGISRQKREWGAMDDGASLILNAKARPFLAADFRLSPLDFISISGLTGILEAPNQEHINKAAWYMLKENEDGTVEKAKDWEDSYFFQNAFSMVMVDLDFTNFHFDFGSTCVWPKRFELGYAFPLIDRVVYQNNIGDYDNMALFGNLKFILPGVGSIWLSGYLDEVNVFFTKFWEKTRAMFAIQAGVKADIPWIPFTTVSFRYTKIEPYCYTHHAINYTPWYAHYISENYTNNGESLGYYLPPNSDEFNLQFNSNPIPALKLGFMYQLIRHGVDWGSGAGIGNNLYSELTNVNRGDLKKYFLRDGTYEWTSIVTLKGWYDFAGLGVPVRLNASLGYVYDWFTGIDGAEPGWKTEYHYISNDEYPSKHGVVANIGFTIFYE